MPSFYIFNVHRVIGETLIECISHCSTIEEATQYAKDRYGSQHVDSGKVTVQGEMQAMKKVDNEL